MTARRQVLFHERFISVVGELTTNDAYSACRAGTIAKFAETGVEPEHRPAMVAALEAKIAEFDRVEKSNGIANRVNNRFKDTVEHLQKALENLSVGEAVMRPTPDMSHNRPPAGFDRRGGHRSSF